MWGKTRARSIRDHWKFGEKYAEYSRRENNGKFLIEEKPRAKEFRVAINRISISNLVSRMNFGQICIWNSLQFSVLNEKIRLNRFRMNIYRT